MTHPNLTGRSSSRYMILRQLGHGNLTRVFLAASRTQGPAELCVLKLMQCELAADEDFRALFLDQAASTLSLRHPGLARTLDVVADAGACGLTLEFLEGQTLARLIERLGRSRFPVDMHLHILSQVLAALEYAREVGAAPVPGFVHRNVCPSNIFITYDGQIKLLGAGFAEATRALEARLGRPLVDVHYAAPEVLRGNEAGPSADLFGVGVMIWEAVARQARVTAEDVAVIIQKRLQGAEPGLERAWPDAPLPMMALCRQALAIDPGKRYPTTSALRAALGAYLARAAESSEAVLQRLPGLMESLFAAEREQTQLFIGSSLRSAIERSPSSLHAGFDTREEPAQEEDWNAPTSARVPAFDLRARPAQSSLPVASGEAPRAATPHGIPRIHARLASPNEAPAPAPFSSTLPAQRTAAQHDAPRDSSTGGHRTDSTSLGSAPRRRSKQRRFSLDVLGPVALILGSIVAAYSLHRHSLRDRNPDVQHLAIQAEEHVLSSPHHAAAAEQRASTAQVEPARDSQRGGAEVTAIPAALLATPDRRASATLDTRPGNELLVSVPAFFDGRTTASYVREPPPPLNAADLPTVDPELSSLQDAILMAAKARRSALKNKRDKAPDAVRATATAAGSVPVGSAPPRPIDMADPYTEPRSE